MKTATPDTKLRDLNVGTRVRILDDRLERVFTVQRFRDDGYVDLYCGGAPSVTAWGGHPVELETCAS